MKRKLLPLVLLSLVALSAFALAEKPEPLYVKEFARTKSGLPGWMQLRRLEIYRVEVLGMKQAVIVLRFYDKLPDSVRYNFIIWFDADRNPKTGAKYSEKGAEYRLEIIGYPMAMTGRILPWNAERERWGYEKGLRKCLRSGKSHFTYRLPNRLFRKLFFQPSDALEPIRGKVMKIGGGPEKGASFTHKVTHRCVKGSEFENLITFRCELPHHPSCRHPP